MTSVEDKYIHKDCTCGKKGGARDSCAAPKDADTIHRGPLAKLRAEARKALEERLNLPGGGNPVDNKTHVAVPPAFIPRDGFTLTVAANGSATYTPVIVQKEPVVAGGGDKGAQTTGGPASVGGAGVNATGPARASVSVAGYTTQMNPDGTVTLKPVASSGNVPPSGTVGPRGNAPSVAVVSSVNVPPSGVQDRTGVVGGVNGGSSKDVPLERALAGMMGGMTSMAAAIETLADVTAEGAARRDEKAAEEKVVLPLAASDVAQMWSKWCSFLEESSSQEMAEVRVDTLMLEIRSAFGVDKLRPESAMSATAAEAMKTIRSTLGLAAEEIFSEVGLSPARKARYETLLAGPGTQLVTAARSESHSMESAGALGARLHGAATVEPAVTAAADRLPAALKVPAWKRAQERRRSFRAGSVAGRGGGRGGNNQRGGGGGGQRNGYRNGYNGGGRGNAGNGRSWDGGGLSRDRRAYGDDRAEMSDGGGGQRSGGRGQQGGGGGGGPRR